ncbi:MAG TPA: hypothetical protein VGW09_10665 [Nitrososphaeraceae archaeon]|nr:hypothetical protein [Nitrososphaeraceae archaeon]
MNRNIVSGILLILLSVIVNFPSPHPILHHNHPVYAHNFSITDDSTISTIIEQIKTETQLVNEYFLSRNNISAIEHAKNAANLSNALNDKLQVRIVDITQAYTNGLYNSTTLALVVANLVDEILRNYGSAYGITYDLTNMSNMMLFNMSNNNDSFSLPINVTTVAENDTLLSDAEPASILENNNPALVNIFNYQTAQALSNNVNRLYSDRLSVQGPVSEKVTVGNLEQSIRDLKYAIDNKARAEVLMEIVHMKIHPMLQSVYDLRLAVR